ncbi:hypothetical protein QBC35DRAFT_515615 [Podospora australis]|uniref:NADH-ubiquinone oxidoreductase 9.5 kDa subunit n=1 Tax=Podospora australis TaxID=1536484 RepID=A0AAN7AG15_9PEZI|nr:hypothetical protein QBC35DRAFT_515615 [Podospora australis]
MAPGAIPHFWQTPLRYLRWSHRERPAYFYSLLIAAMGPITLFTVPPIRKALGDENATPIPLTYPIPTGPRKKLTGYDDDTETD